MKRQKTIKSITNVTNVTSKKSKCLIDQTLIPIANIYKVLSQTSKPSLKVSTVNIHRDTRCESINGTIKPNSRIKLIHHQKLEKQSG